ncbi:MAG TPA: Yip1 family protein [Methanoregulaceae archaeon]|nr:Yip1 family protein [Methanoregulaceae archaeon]
MMQNIIDILIRPDSFFRKRIASEENLKIPFLLVATAGVVGALYGYEAGSLTGRMFAGAGAGVSQLISVSSVVGAFVGVILFWLIGSGVFYLISMAFKGTGTFNRTLECVGYGFIPQIFGSLITLASAFYYLPMVKVPEIKSLTDPVLLQNAVTRLMNDPAMLELTRISVVIGVIFVLWSANIWIYGIKYARSLSFRDAAITILVPVIIYIVYTLVMTFIVSPVPGAQ